MLSEPGYGPFLCRGRLERVRLRKNQEMPLEELPVKYYNQFMDKRGRRLIGVHKQTYAPPEKDALSEKDAPPEKDAPQGGKILAGALSVRQAQEALYQRSVVPSGCLYRGLGKNRPGHEILGPGAGAVHGTD